MQFFYKEKAKNQKGEHVADVTASFNIDLVLKTSQSVDGGLIINLNDGRVETVPVFQRDTKGNVIFKKDGTPNKITSYQEYKNTEIELSLEETKEFIAITAQDPNFPLLYSKPEVGMRTEEPVLEITKAEYSDAVAVE